MSALTTLITMAELWRVGVLAGAPPFIIDPAQQTGLEAELLQTIAADLGRELRLTEANSRRLDFLMREGMLDAIAQHGVPSADCTLTDPFSTWVDGLYVRRSVLLETPDKPLTIVTYNGARPYLLNALEETELKAGAIVELNDVRLAPDFISRRQFDALFGELRILAFEAVQNQTYMAEDLVGPITSVDDVHRLCVRTPAVAQRVNAVLRRLRASGAYDAVVKKYDLPLMSPPATAD